MQKTYDECYLICSTAIYFEGQVRTKKARRVYYAVLMYRDTEQRR